MAYPPGVLPVNRTNATPQTTTHPADHNSANQAINDIVGVLGTSPQGSAGSVTARFAALTSDAAVHGCKWLAGQTIAGTTTTALAPSSVTIDTGGFMPIVTNNFVTIPDDDVYALSVSLTGGAVWSAGAKLTLSSSGQGIVGSNTVETGYNVLAATAVTNFAPGDTITFNVQNYGAAVFVSGIVSVFRVSIL